jgi:hypothetical protein
MAPENKKHKWQNGDKYIQNEARKNYYFCILAIDEFFEFERQWNFPGPVAFNKHFAVRVLPGNLSD